MTQIIHGVIQGNSIVLDAVPQFGEGARVEVVVRPAAPPPSWGEGLRRCAGALADRPELDGYLEEILQERKQDGRQEILE